MTRKQKLELRASEIRTELATLADVEELTEAQRTTLTELRTEYRDCELKIQASSVAGDVPEPTETRSDEVELAGLIAGADIGDIFNSAIEHRSTDGRTRELQEHYGLAANQIPLVLLRGQPIEHRATGVTAAPTNVAQNQSEIIGAVFPQSCAAFLGVDMPSVAVGEAVYPVLSTSADVGTPAENAVQNETAGGFTADVLSPKRLQASFFYSREDRARFRGMSEALRMNLSEALGDKLDQQILNGSNGLLNGTVLSNHNVSAVTSYANYRALFGYGRVDGTFASSIGDIRAVVGASTYAHMSGVFRSDTAGDRAALEDLMAVTGGIKVSAHVPAVSGNKQNAVVRLGMRRDMVSPIWEGISLISDEITKASSGQIVITAVMLHAIKVLRSGGFYKQQSQHA